MILNFILTQKKMQQLLNEFILRGSLKKWLLFALEIDIIVQILWNINTF